MKIDLSDFTRQAETASGALPVSALSRLDTPDPRGALAWSARGSLRGRHGAPRLDLEVDGEVVLVCQRCLLPLTEPVHVSNRFLVASDEDDADRLDQDDEYDVVVGSPAFDLDLLIEDEVLLALPIAPRHATCPDDAPRRPADGRPSPFAALAALKRPPGDADADEDAVDHDADPSPKSGRGG